MPRKNTPKFGIGYGWLLGENPGTEALDELRLNFDAASKEEFACDPLFTSGLWYYYRGGILSRIDGTTNRITGGRLMLQANATNYIYRDNLGVVSSNTLAFPTSCNPMAIVRTNGNGITENTDMRPSNAMGSNVQFISNNPLLNSGTVQDALNQIAFYLQNTLTNVMRSFMFEQLTPSTFWTVNHNLNRYADVLVVDLLGNQMFAEVDYPDANTVTITASEPITGRVYISYPAGSTGFIYEQVNPAIQWQITHTLDHIPTVKVLDFAGNELWAEVDYPGPNTVIITFSETTAGRAVLT